MASVWLQLRDEIDWDFLQDKVDDLLDGGADKANVNAAVREYIEKVALAADLAVDFDKLINGPAEPIGDALEALDFGLVRGALLLIVHMANNKRERLARRLGRLEARLLVGVATEKGEKALKQRLDRLKKRIAAMPGSHE